MSEKQDTSAPTSCSAHGATPAMARPERSKSLFRATVPVEELERHIEERMSEARTYAKIENRLRKNKEIAAFYKGEFFALEGLKKWLATQPSEQAPARNDTLCDPAHGDAGKPKTL